MVKKRIYFRADVGTSIGYGHFIRSLALAEILNKKFDCTFFTSEPTDYQKGELAKVCHFVELKESSKFEDFLNYLVGDEIVVLDNYFFTTEYQRKIKEKGCKLVCIDDMHDKHYVADAIINHAPGTKESQFSKEDYTKLYLGPDYLLLRKEFREAIHIYTPYDENNSIYVCFGGSDDMNLTRKTCEVILASKPRHIDVVVGGSYEYYEDLKLFAQNKDIKVYRNASPETIVELLRKAHLAIVPDSMVFFETCCLRRPCITGYNCDNQMFIAEYNRNNHLSLEIGDLLEVYEQRLRDAYLNITENLMDEYVDNQKRIINDPSDNLTEIFNF